MGYQRLEVPDADLLSRIDVSLQQLFEGRVALLCSTRLLWSVLVHGLLPFPEQGIQHQLNDWWCIHHICNRAWTLLHRRLSDQLKIDSRSAGHFCGKNGYCCADVCLWSRAYVRYRCLEALCDHAQERPDARWLREVQSQS